MTKNSLPVGRYARPFLSNRLLCRTLLDRDMKLSGLIVNKETLRFKGKTSSEVLGHTSSCKF